MAGNGLPKELSKAVRKIRAAGYLVGAPSQSAQKVHVVDPDSGKVLVRFPKTPKNPGNARTHLAANLRRAGAEVPGLTDRR